MNTPANSKYYFLAHIPSPQEKEMHNVLCREGMHLAQTLNIKNHRYRSPTNLKENFIMPKYVARMSLPEEKIRLTTKVFLANLVCSASEKKGHMRLLTSIRKLSQHLNMATNQVYYQLSLLQNITVENKPIIICRPYAVPIPKKDQVKCTRAQKTEQTNTSTDVLQTKKYVNTMQYYTSQLKEREQERIARRNMSFGAWEQPIEIIIVAHTYFSYNREREKDFFFFVSTTWGADKLSLAERYYLFYIQTNIYLNKWREGRPYSILYLDTYADCFGVGINYARKILQSLEAQGYIKLQIENMRTRVELLQKGVRKIPWFKNKLAPAKE